MTAKCRTKRGKLPVFTTATGMRRLTGELRGLTANASGVDELLRQNAFVQTVAVVEQHRHRDRAVFGDIDGRHIPNLQIVGHGADGSLLRLEDFETGSRAVREQGAVPAAGPEGADRRERKQ